MTLRRKPTIRYIVIYMDANIIKIEYFGFYVDVNKLINITTVCLFDNDMKWNLHPIPTPNQPL